MSKRIAGLLAIVTGVVAVAVIAWMVTSPNLDAFAECLSDEGVQFYGAYWCERCSEQKDLFGSAQEFLPYVECSLPDRAGTNPECMRAGVQAYPMWEFQDGSRLSGVIPVEILAERSGCALP